MTLRINSRGFTLLEVILAIAIFALISLAGFTIFNTVLTSDETSRRHTDKLNEIQRAFLIIERDVLQLARRRVRINGEAPLEGYLHTDAGNFSSATKMMGFVRGGWRNPGLLLPRSDMQAVAYRLNDSVFERLHYNFVDPVNGEEPKVRPLITQVKSIDFEFFDGEKWQPQVVENAIPLAIAIEVDIEDFGLIRRQFLVAGDDLSAKAVE